MKSVVGDITIPLYDSSKADPAAPINAPSAQMKFADYIDLIQREPTDYAFSCLTRSSTRPAYLTTMCHRRT